MNKQKIKNFVKEHKKEILIGVAGTAIGVSGTLIGHRQVLPRLKGRVRMPGFCIEGGLTIADIGKLGEEFIKHDPELTKDTPILEVGHFKFG